MEDNLCSNLVQFYKVLGIDIFFSNIQNPKALNNNKKEFLINKQEDNTQNNIEKCDYSNNLINTTKNSINYDLNNIKNSTKPELSKLLLEINNIDCPIRHTARSTVVFDGNIDSKLMIIGEAPGQEEDIQCKPFVGQSGILLNNMLKAIGLSREDSIISNIVFWRPPFNRTPSTDEISLCLPYVNRLIKIVNPKVLLLLGAVSNHALLNNNLPMSKLRGNVNNVLGIKAVSTYHPAYLLRSSNQKKYVFKDLLILKSNIE